MFLHIFYTWIIANLLHPVFMMLGIFILNESTASDSEFFEIYLLIVFCSFIVSVPCLLFSWFSLYLISNTPYTTDAKYLVWLVTVSLTVFLEVFVILLIVDDVNSTTLLFSVPGVAATIVAIMLRYWQFKNLIQIMEIKKNETNVA
jgi:hypothetical protein